MINISIIEMAILIILFYGLRWGGRILFLYTVKNMIDKKLQEVVINESNA